ncbi:MAG TPA: CehA/McbA family metallohydrolase [Bacillota bacterium]|nr:CehA/McbA family metallohydrolase [Bacillota bacterium]
MMKKILCLFFSSLLVLVIGCSSTTTTTSATTTTTTQDLYPATLYGRILTDSGDMITAGIVITSAKGDMTRVNSNVLSGYRLLLDEGTYTLTYVRGPEYSRVSRTIFVENYKTYYLDDVRLTHLYDGVASGWYMGDLHQHSTFSDGKQTVDEVLLSNINNGLHFGFLSDHNSSSGLAEWVQGNRFVSAYDSVGDPLFFMAMRAVEVTTDYGHFQSLGIGNVFEKADISVLKGDDPVADITEMMQEIGRSGGIAQINHPFATALLGFHHWEIVEEFDTIEIWNGLYEPNANENLAAKIKWFELLNLYSAGELKYLPATGGSDNHSISGTYTARYANLSTPEGRYSDSYLRRGVYSGVPATVVHIEGELNEAAIMDALLSGHSFITNGPMVVATIDGVGYGDTVSLSDQDSVSVDISVFSRDPMNQLIIYKNGEIMTTIDIDSESIRYNDAIEISGVEPGDWLVFEVIGEEVLYAITNPIFIGI